MKEVFMNLGFGDQQTEFILNHPEILTYASPRHSYNALVCIATLVMREKDCTPILNPDISDDLMDLIMKGISRGFNVNLYNDPELPFLTALVIFKLIERDIEPVGFTKDMTKDEVYKKYNEMLDEYVPTKIKIEEEMLRWN